MLRNLTETQRLYEELLSITKEQLHVLENKSDIEGLQAEGRSDLALQRFSALSLDWVLLSQRIDCAIAELESTDKLKLHDLVTDFFTEMSELNIVIEDRLQSIRNQSVDMLGRLKQNRMVVRSYGGLDNVDTTPMYFDEKN